MNAKTVLALCLLITLSSGYLGQKYHASAKTLKSQAAAASRDMSAAQESLGSLQELLKADEAPQVLDQTTGQTLLAIYNLRMPHSVTVNQLTPGKLGASVDTPVNDLAEDVPGSLLKTVKVNMTGSYTNYHGLLNYFNELQAQGPVALTRLKVQDNTFEASVRVYGILN